MNEIQKRRGFEPGKFSQMVGTELVENVEREKLLHIVVDYPLWKTKNLLKTFRRDFPLPPEGYPPGKDNSNGSPYLSRMFLMMSSTVAFSWGLVFSFSSTLWMA